MFTEYVANSNTLYSRCYTSRMKFRALQENLRKALWERIEEGELTGLRLARDTGFKQAHISNFLNRKRGLSVEGMDKVLNVQRLSVLDLLDPGEINKRASIAPPSQDDFENVLLVDGAVAARQPVIMSMKVKDIVKLKKSFLRKLRPEMEGDREHWERFVIIRADGREGMSMYPSPAARRHRPDRPPLQFAQALSQRRIQHVRGRQERHLHREICRSRGQSPGPAPPQHAYPVEVMADGAGQESPRLPDRARLLCGN